jgi:hypothetical protein
MYEIIVYKYGNPIFNNSVDDFKKYRGVEEKGRLKFTDDNVYEGKITNKILYFYKEKEEVPMLLICFNSEASLKRYIKLSKMYCKLI